MTLTRLSRMLRMPMLALVALNAAVFFAYTAPRTLQERSLEARAAALRGDLQLARERAAATRQRTETLRQNGEDARQFLEKVVADRRASVVPVLQELVRTATELGLKTDRQSYATEAVKGLPITRMRITMPMTGSYQQLASLLQRLEASPHFLTVDEIALHEQAGSGGASLTMSLSAYFRSEGTP